MDATSPDFKPGEKWESKEDRAKAAQISHMGNIALQNPVKRCSRCNKIAEGTDNYCGGCGNRLRTVLLEQTKEEKERVAAWRAAGAAAKAAAASGETKEEASSEEPMSEEKLQQMLIKCPHDDCESSMHRAFGAPNQKKLGKRECVVCRKKFRIEDKKKLEQHKEAVKQLKLIQRNTKKKGGYKKSRKKKRKTKRRKTRRKRKSRKQRKKRKSRRK
jgi:hypothetical protein